MLLVFIVTVLGIVVVNAVDDIMVTHRRIMLVAMVIVFKIVMVTTIDVVMVTITQLC